jgi:hypothetical protein
MVLGVVTNASRAGARAGVVSAGTYSNVTTAVNSALSQGAITASPTVTVTVNGTTVTSDATFAAASTAGVSVSVKVSLNYDNVSWIPGAAWFLSGVTLSETAIMRRES